MRDDMIFFIMSVLSDEQGISEESYNLLLDIAQSDGALPELRERVLRYVDATDGRFYLKE